MNSTRSSFTPDGGSPSQLEPSDEPPDLSHGHDDPGVVADPFGLADASSLVNYDDDALVEVGVGEVDYRLDAGKAGTALCISSREAGTWRWQFVAEAKWDGRTLRCRALDRTVLEQLALELREIGADDG